ncbi:hypothetical protein K9M06_01265, partial [Candidatus Bipolaricaulota bacterium]|nr:hypothetical protein [Candidatus Bipolaricaulota bacterium]
YGARPMRLTIETLIENKISDHLLQGDFNDTDSIYVDTEQEDIVLEGVRDKSTVGVGD